MNKEHFHSWFRTSHGLNKLVTNLNDNEQEISEMQFEDYALQLNARAFASRSKATAKRQRCSSASSSTKTLPIGERTWTDIEPQDYSVTAFSVSKKQINLLRHGSLPRDNDGAVEFWKIKDYLQHHFVHSRHWSVEKWKSIMARGRGNRRIFQYCTDSSGKILYLRAFQGHSGRNLIDFSLQDNVFDSERFRQIHLSRWMCGQFTLHHKFRIDTERDKFEQKTDSILSACESYEQKTRRSWDSWPESTSSCTIPADSMKETSKH